MRKTKRLQLRGETGRVLDHDDLAGVAGGLVPSQSCKTHESTCQWPDPRRLIVGLLVLCMCLVGCTQPAPTGSIESTSTVEGVYDQTPSGDQAIAGELSCLVEQHVADGSEIDPDMRNQCYCYYGGECDCCFWFADGSMCCSYCFDRADGTRHCYFSCSGAPQEGV